MVLSLLCHFKFLIIKFNYKTPGREDEPTTEIVADSQRSTTIVEGLGGSENIATVDCCATRLRITLNRNELVNKQMLMSTGAKGVIIKGRAYKLSMDHMLQILKMNLNSY